MTKPVLAPKDVKFNDVTLYAKALFKQLRLERGYSMKEGADLLGIRVKNLEDIEATREYGCHINITHIDAFARAYIVSPTIFFVIPEYE